jgi:hypothetical protein
MGTTVLNILSQDLHNREPKMDQLLDQGIAKGLIALDAGQKNISYKT